MASRIIPVDLPQTLADFAQRLTKIEAQLAALEAAKAPKPTEQPKKK